MEIETPMSYIYCNLDLKVRSETDHYTIEAQGPWGETVQSLCNLPSLAELHALIEQVQTKSDQAALEELGNSLFQLLFPTDVRLLYEAAKARLKEDVGLRLRLRLPNVLTPLPWEFLYEVPFYLTADPRLSIVRFLELREVPQPLTVQPPLRMLLVISSPNDVPPL
jgi:hypothetical protein